MKEGLGMNGMLTVSERIPPKGILASVMRRLLFIPSIARLYWRGGWQEIASQHNLITNTGYNVVANTLSGVGTYANKAFTFFAYSNGTTAPAITDTATTFYADGTQNATQPVNQIAAFNVATLSEVWTCYISSTQNAVNPITKFALMDALVGLNMFNEILLATPLSKNSQKEYQLAYTLTLSQA